MITVDKLLYFAGQSLLKCYGTLSLNNVRILISIVLELEENSVEMMWSNKLCSLSSAMRIRHFKTIEALAACPWVVNPVWKTYKGNLFLPRESWFLLEDDKDWQCWIFNRDHEWDMGRSGKNNSSSSPLRHPLPPSSVPCETEHCYSRTI